MKREADSDLSRLDAPLSGIVLEDEMLGEVVLEFAVVSLVSSFTLRMASDTTKPSVTTIMAIALSIAQKGFLPRCSARWPIARKIKAIMMPIAWPITLWWRLRLRLDMGIGHLGGPADVHLTANRRLDSGTLKSYVTHAAFSLFGGRRQELDLWVEKSVLSVSFAEAELFY